MAHFTRTVKAGLPPIVEAVFHISLPRLGALNASQSQIPDPVRGLALLDTGADGSCLDPEVVSHLQLNERGVTEVLTPSSGPKGHTAIEYDVGIIIPPGRQQDSPLVINCVPVMASKLLSQGIHALIGRDILQHCIFHYNGSGYFSLAW